MAGWSNISVASRAGGIGRLDHGTQKCTNGLLLFAHAPCLGCVSRRKDEAALAILWTRPDPLSAGAFGQDNSLHLARSVVFDLMAAEQAHQLGENFPDQSLFRSWHRLGFVSALVGSIPRGHEQSDFHVPKSDRAASRRGPCHLVLSEQTRLAI